jgi:hypothetical protein
LEVARAHTIVNKIFNEQAALEFFTGSLKSKYDYAKHFGCTPVSAMRHINLLDTKLVIKGWVGRAALYSIRTSDSEYDMMHPSEQGHIKERERIFDTVMQAMKGQFDKAMAQATTPEAKQQAKLQFANDVFEEYDVVYGKHCEARAAFHNKEAERAANRRRIEKPSAASLLGSLLASWARPVTETLIPEMA